MNITVSLQTFKYCVFGKHFRYAVCAINGKYLRNAIPHDCRRYSNLVERKLLNGAVLRPTSTCVFIPNRITIVSSYHSAHRSVFDIDTNVKNDVVLYENKSTYLEILGFLAVMQLGAWLFFAYSFFKISRALPEEEKETKLFGIISLKEKKWSIGIPGAFICTGLMVFTLMFSFAQKNVRQIILHKGGKTVFIETFGMFGSGLKRKFNLDELSCRISRQKQRGYLPLRYKGIWFNLLVDAEGDFKDPYLFDMTAGMYRDSVAKPSKK